MRRSSDAAPGCELRLRQGDGVTRQRRQWSASGPELHRSLLSGVQRGQRSLLSRSGAASTSLVGATFGFSDGEGSAALLRGLNLQRADFTGATFIDTDLASKVLADSRFARFRFLPGHGMGGMFHISAVGADLDGGEFVSHYFCDVDLTDAGLRASSFRGLIGVSCAEFLLNEVYDALPSRSWSSTVPT